MWKWCLYEWRIPSPMYDGWGKRTNTENQPKSECGQNVGPLSKCKSPSKTRRRQKDVQDPILEVDRLVTQLKDEASWKRYCIMNMLRKATFAMACHLTRREGERATRKWFESAISNMIRIFQVCLWFEWIFYLRNGLKHISHLLNWFKFHSEGEDLWRMG